VLGDGYQAKMREPFVIYDPELRGIEMVKAEPYMGKPGTPGIDRDPAHLRNTYNMEEELLEAVREIGAAYEKISPEVVEYEQFETEDAKVLLVAHGIVSRAAQGAVKVLRQQGYQVGHFRPITLRPFPGVELKAAADKARHVLLIESSYGQFKKLVTDGIYGCTTPILSYLKPGEGITVEEIVAEAKKLF
jgi:2-oxoglutarate ferredoxin oxidoreductase subunit alpha